MSALDERRQRAGQAFLDAIPGFVKIPHAPDPLSQAIETATRVRITPEIIAAAYPGLGPDSRKHMRPVIEAAFRAAGFEVEQ